MRNVDAAGLEIGDDHPPRIMGVLNVSAESPYDPSVYDDPGEAAEYVDEELIGEGADIVDVGLESANKDLDVLGRTGVGSARHRDRDAGVDLGRRRLVDRDPLPRGRRRGACTRVRHGQRHLRLRRSRDARVCREHDAAVSKMASPPDLERPGAIEDVDEIYEALSMNGLTDKTILDPAFGGWSKAKPTPTTARRSTGYGSSAATVARCSSRSTARASSRRSRDGVPRRPFRCRSPPPRWQSSAAHT